ncbi:type I-E CRISPR-associated protein Cse1/CasA [Gordonia sihwensis]|uniref:type I-E CRISPR-associated protein Cse1/CasA n=1 Tax=Gordonia sihwensis TaxID=173559 RepID=UPI0005F0B552|nr:type I-E CRISPR-associated protein Cse1/CasA [Gordonia sihwensis]KJR10511.1 hypothetical protein UG54_00500 [Gordonia sihwensis]
MSSDTASSTDFNLADEAWIPVLTARGATEVGLTELFDNTDQIAAIASGSVIVDAALLRLLLAVDAAADHAGISAARWVVGHQASFNLFDTTIPFWQNASMRELEELKSALSTAPGLTRPNGALESMANSPNSALAGLQRTRLTPAEAARALVMRQQFSTGGLQSFPAKAAYGQPPSAKSTIANQAPLVIVEGRTLADTLTASRYTAADAPIGQFQFTWNPADKPYADGIPVGVVDTLTWQARSMLLHRDADGLVDAYMCSEGLRYGALQPALLPHTTYQQKTKGADWTVRAPHHQRPAWRQLLDAYAAGSPGLLSHLPASTSTTGPQSVKLLGLSSFQGRIDGHVTGAIPLPAIPAEAAAALSDAVGNAYKEVSSALGSAGAAINASGWGDRRRDAFTATVEPAAAAIVADALHGTVTVDDAVSSLAAVGYRAATHVAEAHTDAYPAVAGMLTARVTDRAATAARKES